MKHLKLFENENQKIWMYQEADDYSSFGISTYLFDNKEILFKFVLNKAYNIIDSLDDDEKEEYYKVLDECNDYEAII